MTESQNPVRLLAGIHPDIVHHLAAYRILRMHAYHVIHDGPGLFEQSSFQVMVCESVLEVEVAGLELESIAKFAFRRREVSHMCV